MAGNHKRSKDWVLKLVDAPATKVCPLHCSGKQLRPTFIPAAIQAVFSNVSVFIYFSSSCAHYSLFYCKNLWLENTARWQMSFLIRDLGAPCTFFINTIPNLKFSSPALHLLPPNRPVWKELIGFCAAPAALPGAVLKKNAGKKKKRWVKKMRKNSEEGYKCLNVNFKSLAWATTIFSFALLEKHSAAMMWVHEFINTPVLTTLRCVKVPALWNKKECQNQTNLHFLPVEYKLDILKCHNHVIK